uniref:Uncharacterized protein n=1 Tax=Arundo donax TaxID=35708 RepID=A0A0A9AR23_ARUDO
MSPATLQWWPAQGLDLAPAARIQRPARGLDLAWPRQQAPTVFLSVQMAPQLRAAMDLPLKLLPQPPPTAMIRPCSCCPNVDPPWLGGCSFLAPTDYSHGFSSTTYNHGSAGIGNASCCELATSYGSPSLMMRPDLGTRIHGRLLDLYCFLGIQLV